MADRSALKFIPISIQTIKNDSIKSFDLFIKTKTGRLVLYSSREELFTQEVHDTLLANGISVLYINEKDKDAYNAYLAENLAGILSDPEYSNSDKAEFAYLSISNIARALFEKPSEQLITSYKMAIAATMDFVLSENDAVSNLIQLTEFDQSTYNHSINVGIFATGLSKAIFSGDPDLNMAEIAAGFFLHDIGKCEIPLTILRKPGRLTHAEWNIIKTHPVKGHEILTKFNHITPESRLIVLQHHERNDGKGYPRGLKGEMIHVYSKICSIADVFEALVAERPYKKQLSFYYALNTMKSEMKNEFDPEFFKQFVLLFSESRYS
ncbi:HD-GYP domain-containing protein [bacterium]|nr:HD-GYP domain-containing protein [bacterium]